ncbi:MAG: SusE domain-containing protein [Mariniphaga sp.]|nr:SusE domain-containing protein [Mariniphaga sp.]
MKKIHHILIIFLAASLLFACEDMEREPVIIPGDAPALSQPASGTQVVFQRVNASEQSITFTWSEADFGFPSATVYNLQVDVAGNNFASATQLASTSELSVSITHATLNERLMTKGLPPNEPTAIEFRVEATVNPKYSLYSQPVNMTVTLYAASFPPIYMIGASVGGWDTSKAVEVVSTGEPFQYITVWRFDASNGANFRFFSQPEWSASLGGYDKFTSYPEDLLEPATGDDDPNFNFIGTAGWYEIKVNTETGTIEMAAVNEPGMYLTGDATHGWNWDEPVTALQYKSYKLWEGDVTFIQGGAFRLFAQKDWGPTSYGYDVVVNYDTDYIDVMEGHDDPNWEFLKPSGTYHVVVNLRTNTIEISE